MGPPLAATFISRPWPRVRRKWAELQARSFIASDAILDMDLLVEEPTFEEFARPLPCVRRKLHLWAEFQARSFRATDAIIDLLAEEPTFQEFARLELASLRERDRKDGLMLAAGIQDAIDEGLLKDVGPPPAYIDIDVMKHDAEARATYIKSRLPQEAGSVTGCTVVLVGASSTGKGSTCDKFLKLVSGSSVWSNGNCFRCLTLLAVLHCERQGKDFDPDCLSKENLGSWTRMLEIRKSDAAGWDISVNGLGLKESVSQIQNTLLKEARVVQHLPAVAKKTQFHVIDFARKALSAMSDDGAVVLIEGRTETLDHIPSPFRFRLVMPEAGQKVLGERQAALQIEARVRQILEDLAASRLPEDLKAELFEDAVHCVLKELARQRGL